MSDFFKSQEIEVEIGGHLSGGDLNEIVFVYDSTNDRGEPTPIELGQILTIPDRSGIGKFLARVTNIRYGQDKEFQTEVARNMNLQQKSSLEGEHSDPRNVFMSDQRDQLFLEAVCEILGFFDQNNKFFSPKRLPSYFSSVRKVTIQDVSTLSSRFGDMPFGKLRSGSDILDVNVGLFEELVPYHVGIFAQTGGGKTNTILNIIAKSIESEGRVGMIAFDPHGEYIKELAKHPMAAENLSIYSLYSKGSKVNDIRISYKDLTTSILINLKDQFGWTQAQEEFLREVSFENDDWFSEILSVPLDQFEARRKEEEEGKGNDNFMESLAQLAETGEVSSSPASTLQSRYPDFKVETIRSIRRKLRQIVTANHIVPNESASSVPEILAELKKGKVVLMDISGLEGLHELLISSLFAKKLFDTWKYYYANKYEKFLELPVVSVVMEEAQRVLNTVSSGNIFAQICAEGRKFRTGLIAITQRPQAVHEDILSQINTYIILGLADENGFKILSQKTKKPIQKLRFEIQALMPGQAIMTNPLSPFAVPFQVNFYPDYIEELRKKYTTRRSHAPKPTQFEGFM